MIRLESNLLHDLAVPLKPEAGNRSPMLKIPAASAAGPGVVEIESIDSVVLSRLRWHYVRRPNDGNTKNTAEFDKNGEPRFHEIGLLKISFVADKKPVPGPEAA